MLIYHSCQSKYPIERFISSLERFCECDISIAFIEDDDWDTEKYQSYDLYIYPHIDLTHHNPWKVHIGIFDYTEMDECEYFLHSRISHIITYQHKTGVKCKKLIPHTFYNISGWQRVMKHVSEEHLEYILLDFLDELVLYRTFLPLAYPWKGIIHYGTDTSRNCLRSLEDPDIVFSMKYSHSFITLSQDLKNKLLFRGYHPVKVLLHPYEYSSSKFCVSRFLAQPEILVMGNFCRDPNQVKILDNLIPEEINIKITFQLDKKLDYDRLLKKMCGCVLFSWYNDVSASMLILEALHHHIPIIVNRKPAIEEYLGTEYPLYVDTCENWVHFKEQVIATHEYLKSIKLDLSFDTFLNGLYDQKRIGGSSG